MRIRAWGETLVLLQTGEVAQLLAITRTGREAVVMTDKMLRKVSVDKIRIYNGTPGERLAYVFNVGIDAIQNIKSRRREKGQTEGITAERINAESITAEKLDTTFSYTSILKRKKKE